MNRNLGGRSASQIDRIPRSLFPPKTALCCIKAKGHFVAHAASGIPNSSLLLPLRLHTVQRAREEGSDRSAARLTGSGRFGNRGEKCKSSRTDGAGQGSDRSEGEGASAAACAAPRASFDRWNGLVQSIFATRRSHLGQYVLLSALISHLHVLLDC